MTRTEAIDLLAQEIGKMEVIKGSENWSIQYQSSTGDTGLAPAYGATFYEALEKVVIAKFGEYFEQVALARTTQSLPIVDIAKINKSVVYLADVFNQLFAVSIDPDTLYWIHPESNMLFSVDLEGDVMVDLNGQVLGYGLTDWGDFLAAHVDSLKVIDRDKQTDYLYQFKSHFGVDDEFDHTEWPKVQGIEHLHTAQIISMRELVDTGKISAQKLRSVGEGNSPCDIYSVTLSLAGE